MAAVVKGNVDKIPCPNLNPSIHFHELQVGLVSHHRKSVYSVEVKFLSRFCALVLRIYLSSNNREN